LSFAQAEENIVAINLSTNTISPGCPAQVDVEFMDCKAGAGDFTVMMAIVPAGVCKFKSPWGDPNFNQGVRNFSDFQDIIVSSNGYGALYRSGIDYYLLSDGSGCNITTWPTFRGLHFCLGCIGCHMETCDSAWMSNIDLYPNCGTGGGPGKLTL